MVLWGRRRLQLPDTELCNGVHKRQWWRRYVCQLPHAAFATSTLCLATIWLSSVSDKDLRDRDDHTNSKPPWRDFHHLGSPAHVLLLHGRAATSKARHHAGHSSQKIVARNILLTLLLFEFGGVIWSFEMRVKVPPSSRDVKHMSTRFRNCTDKTWGRPHHGRVALIEPRWAPLAVILWRSTRPRHP